MESTLRIIESTSGLITALAAVVALYFEWRRRRRKAESGTPRSLHGLSRDARRLLEHVRSRSQSYAELSEKWWPGNPGNTSEGSTATASAFEQLNEPALMKAVGVDSPVTFRALVQDVESRGLVAVHEEDPWSTPHLLITELGLAVLKKRIPSELRPAQT